MPDSMDQTVTTEIIRLHQELIGLAGRSLDLAIHLGELLTTKKAALKHGEWTNWMTANLPFSPRTGQNYIRLYEQRDRIKNENVSDLSDAYRLMIEPRKKPMSLEESKACVERIRLEVSGFKSACERLIAFRDARGYSPDFESFEAFLQSIGHDANWFARVEKIHLAVVAAAKGEGSMADAMEMFIEVSDQLSA